MDSTLFFTALLHHHIPSNTTYKVLSSADPNIEQVNSVSNALLNIINIINIIDINITLHLWIFLRNFYRYDSFSIISHWQILSCNKGILEVNKEISLIKHMTHGSICNDYCWLWFPLLYQKIVSHGLNKIYLRCEILRQKTGMKFHTEVSKKIRYYNK